MELLDESFKARTCDQGDFRRMEVPAHTLGPCVTQTIGSFLSTTTDWLIIHQSLQHVSKHGRPEGAAHRSL